MVLMDYDINLDQSSTIVRSETQKEAGHEYIVSDNIQICLYCMGKYIDTSANMYCAVMISVRLSYYKEY